MLHSYDNKAIMQHSLFCPNSTNASIEAALSLWMFQFREEEEDHDSENGEKREQGHQNGNHADYQRSNSVSSKTDQDHGRTKTPAGNVRRILGPATEHLRRDLAWWTRGEITSTFEVQTKADVGYEKSYLTLGFCGLGK